MIRNIFSISILLCLCGYGFGQVKKPGRISSPDKQMYMEYGIDKTGKLLYHVVYTGQEIVGWSSMGLDVNRIKAGENTAMKKPVQKSINEKFAWSLGETDTIVNHYNEVVIPCQSYDLQFNLIVRVYDGSVAFRYQIPSQKGLTGTDIRKEYTTFNFTSAYTIYQYNQESVFSPVKVDSMSKTCDFPATLTNGKFYLSIGEAENENYTKGELKKGEKSNSLVIAFPRDSVVRGESSYQTPWRTISVTNSAIGLHQFSDLFLRLTKPLAEGITSWIKPGKLIRSQLNTQSGMDCIDFAVKHNLQYIMFDAGWYGAEFRSTSDPTKIIPQMDLPAIIKYGKEKGIGVILYVNYVGLRAKLDTIIPLYKQWGVSGFKFGFVDGLTQKGLTWLSSAIKKVNDAGFILDIHDNYKPTGLSRKYPALLTQEGIRGDENSPDAFHTTVLPFTRFIAGPADFTFCFPNPQNSYSKNIKVSKAQQLALTVVFFSPLQSLYWYGRPLDYTNVDEIEFFDKVPTVWNESHYLAGEIGKYASVARRHGDTWFVGNVAGFEDWKGSIKLDFLIKNKSYTVTIYEDDETGTIRKRIIQVKGGDSFSVDLKAKGGQALIISSAKE